MKESVAVAKEAAAKKDFSPAKSDISIHRVRDEPERQLDSLRGVIGNIRRDGGRPSVENIATQLSGMHSIQRAPALLALQRTHGNRYVQRVVAGIRAKLKIGHLGDIYEQEADRGAEKVMRMAEPRVSKDTAFSGQGQCDHTVQRLNQTEQMGILNGRGLSKLTITASPQESETGTPTTSGGSPTTSYTHPFTAIALEARMATEECQVPEGEYGASKVVRFGIRDFNGQRVSNNFTVDEQFRHIGGNRAVYQRLTRRSKQAVQGLFNDCYRLFQPFQWPSDFRLEIEQNHLVDSEIISRNHITFTPTNISVCVFPRPLGNHNFESRCRRY